MYKKEELIELIKKGLENNIITRNDVLDTIAPKNGISYGLDTFKRKFSLSKLFSYIGVIIILLGIMFLTAVNWMVIGSLGQVSVTLGLGLILFISASLIADLKNGKYTFLSNGIYIISGILMPIGSFVLLSKITDNPTSPELVISLIFSLWTFIFLISEVYFKKGIQLFILTLFGTIAYSSWVSYISTVLDYSIYIAPTALMVYSIIISTITALYYKSKRTNYYLLMLLISTITTPIAIYNFVYIFIRDVPNISLIWDVLFLLVAIPMFWISSRINSKVMSVLTAVGMVFWLIYLNSVYFAGQSSFGINLITSGIIIIASSLLYLKFSKK